MTEIAAGVNVLSQTAEEFGNDVSTANTFMKSFQFLAHVTMLRICILLIIIDNIL